MATARPDLDTNERRRRLARRQHLAPSARAPSAEAAAEGSVGFHASDPVSVYLAAWARVRGFERADLERALYDERTLLKVLGMRRTMFVTPVAIAGLIQAACAATIAHRERARLLRMLAGAGIAEDTEAWLARVEDETVETLERLGEATATELAKAVAGLSSQIPIGTGTRWEGPVGVSTRLLFLLAGEGRIIRGRPKGTLVSSLYRWVPMDRWVPGGLPIPPVAEARAALAGRYLAAFGPATRLDLQWWSGWSVAETQRALAAVQAVEVNLDAGATGWVLPDDDDAAPDEPEPWVAFLPALDPTVMGWKERDWYLGEHVGRLFDRNGNAGPSVWLDGRLVGAWAQRRDGEVRWELLEDVGAEGRRRVEAKAGELRSWLGDLRFVPRFRTPLEQELVAHP